MTLPTDGKLRANALDEMEIRSDRGCIGPFYWVNSFVMRTSIGPVQVWGGFTWGRTLTLDSEALYAPAV
jgi:hypothetical protein